MKKVIRVLFAMLANLFVGGAMASVAGVHPLIGGLGLNGLSILLPALPQGLRLGVYTEVWTGEVVKKLRMDESQFGWLNAIPSYDQYAENDIIHLVDVGVDPEVLVNNTTYPIPLADLSEADITIKLDKFQTKPTRIKDDELYAISYDKMGIAIELHQKSLLEKKLLKFLHALAPESHSKKTPVLLTTGDTSADGGRKIFRREDVIALKKEFDKMHVPQNGRILILCPDHIQDLLEQDQKFSGQYYNYTTGAIAKMYGFEIYEHTDTPYYTVSTKTKQAFGAIPGEGERQASTAFYAPRMMRASGSTKFYHSEAKTSPEYQQSLISYRHYAICLPKKKEAIAAILSATA